tara:strand:+ start:473 stop:766 length:294 start_codon:yes stop_codon:yes gene_type:complete
MWWIFFTIFLLVSILSSTLLFYALKRINQYEELLISIQEIVSFSSKKLKDVDAQGSFEADDEIGFIFEEIKSIQSILDGIFENEIITGEKLDDKKNN